MGKFDRAQAALTRRMKAANPRTISYARGAVVVALTGWYGQGLAVSTADAGARVEVSDREFFLAAADLSAAGLGLPEIGDRLSVAGEAAVYEVLTPDTGEPAWRYSDAEKTRLRIHTQQVK